ncbi:unnamed protein product, partial [Didymodactylos carnosus]
ENFRVNTNYRQRKCRLKKHKRLINNKPSSFQNCQSFGKAMKKVTSALQCNKKKKDVIQHLAQKYNLVPKSVQQRTCANISDQIKNAVHKFYLKDDVSYQLPEENKGIIISRSSFADLRPPFVVPKAALAHRICVCIYHENANLILKAIDKFVKGNVCSSLQQFTGTLVCNTVNQECMFPACPLCESNFQEKVIDNVVSAATRIKWWQCVNIHGRAEKKEFEGSVDEAVELLKSKVKYFLFHVYIKRERSNYFEQLKSEVTDEKVVIQVDFAENFGLKEQDEIQSAHWNRKTLSIFTAYVWSKRFFIYASIEWRLSR